LVVYSSILAIRCVTLCEINIDIQLFSTDRNGKGGMQ
jgi:hypothetical protein